MRFISLRHFVSTWYESFFTEVHLSSLTQENEGLQLELGLRLQMCRSDLRLSLSGLLAFKTSSWQKLPRYCIEFHQKPNDTPILNNLRNLFSPSVLSIISDRWNHPNCDPSKQFHFSWPIREVDKSKDIVHIYAPIEGIRGARATRNKLEDKEATCSLLSCSSSVQRFFPFSSASCASLLAVMIGPQTATIVRKANWGRFVSLYECNAAIVER